LARIPLAALAALALSVLLLAPRPARAEPEEPSVRVQEAPPGLVSGARLAPVRATVVRFSELARLEALRGGPRPPVRPLLMKELEEPGEPLGAPAPASVFSPIRPFVASPTPVISFQGLDDIPMVDSSFIVIPPDCGGAVGPDKIMQGLNNNYRVLNKADGSVVSTVGTATFWAPTGETALNALTDPRTLYDPYNNRWIVEMQTTTTGAGDILLGVSQTSDPNGAWNLFKFATGSTIDFPIVGFNRDWVVVAINQYTNGGTFSAGIELVADYGQLRSGTLSGTVFTQAKGTHFCTAPCATYSTTSDTLYLVTHLSSSGATYVVDRITGTPSAPVYTNGITRVRSGGGWTQPSGQILPQAVPNAGTSSCGATPCPIETQDAQVRSAPVYRDGSIWYTQTIGLPAGGVISHTAVQWTKLTATSGAMVDGGRIEDPTATTMSGVWYAYPHVAVNSTGDFIVGYSQFGAGVHPSAGYSVHQAADAAGTIRDPNIYKAGEDYYHKDFGGGRNRWGDFSQAQVDPTDDKSLWVIDEYAKNRVGTNDGTTGSNSSRWSTYWAKVGFAVPPTVTLGPGPSLPEGNSGTTLFPFPVNLSQTSTSPVVVHYHTMDGTATVADSDYVAANDSLTIAAGLLGGTINVAVIGDTICESNETFSLVLSSVTNGNLGSPSTATATILDDDSKTITASAGPNGTIAPLGPVSVVCGGSQTFTITPAANYHVADVLVDGLSVGAVTSYPFTNVTLSHTINATFAIDMHTLTVTVVGHGTVSKSPDQPSYNAGSMVNLTANPDPGYALSAWSGDASGNANPLSVTMNADKNITATFVDTVGPTVKVLAPHGGESLIVGANFDIKWTATDNDSVTAIDLLLSRHGIGGPYESIASGLPNSGLYTWTVTAPVTDSALVKVVGHDVAANTGAAVSDSLFQITDATAATAKPVAVLSLAAPLPNPATSSIHFQFGLPRDANMRLAILDVTGREVAVLFSGRQSPGWHATTWTGRAGAGVYFAELTSEGKRIVRRFAMLR
jgi:hypothetical protein